LIERTLQLNVFLPCPHQVGWEGLKLFFKGSLVVVRLGFSLKRSETVHQGICETFWEVTPEKGA
jgi:hypothetical protein